MHFFSVLGNLGSQWTADEGTLRRWLARRVERCHPPLVLPVHPPSFPVASSHSVRTYVSSVCDPGTVSSTHVDIPGLPPLETPTRSYPSRRRRGAGRGAPAISRRARNFFPFLPGGGAAADRSARRRVVGPRTVSLPRPGPFHLRPVEQRSVSGRDACPVYSVRPDMHRLYTRSFCLAVRPGTIQRSMYTSEGLFCLQRKKIKTCSCQATPLPP